MNIEREAGRSLLTENISKVGEWLSYTLSCQMDDVLIGGHDMILEYQKITILHNLDFLPIPVSSLWLKESW